ADLAPTTDLADVDAAAGYAAMQLRTSAQCTSPWGTLPRRAAGPRSCAPLCPGPEFGFRHRDPGKRDRPYLVLKTPLEALAHVTTDAALAVLLAVHVVAEPAIEFDVLDEALVGVEPDLHEARRPRQRLGMGHQPAAKAAPLEGRRHGHVLDQQV